ncbi:hypothetical protein GGI02_004207 [Coemansia sp. RSA 2322]|nr:hypothetical protein GGI02_004207 [Coemansia sp. RSA 2322]KAJ2479271.1 hypothetical protein EV174_004065 [Coemansia sp. RSA 2320]
MKTKRNETSTDQTRLQKRSLVQASTSSVNDNNTDSADSSVSSRTRARSKQTSSNRGQDSPAQATRPSQAPSRRRGTVSAGSTVSAPETIQLANSEAANGFSHVESNPQPSETLIMPPASAPPCSGNAATDNAASHLSLPGVGSLLSPPGTKAQQYASAHPVTYAQSSHQATLVAPEPHAPLLLLAGMVPPQHARQPLYSTNEQGFALRQEMLPSPPQQLLGPSMGRRTPKKPAMAFLYAVARIADNSDNWSWIRWSESGEELEIGDWDLFIMSLNSLGFTASKRESVMKNFYGYGFELLTDARRRIPSGDGQEWSVLKQDSFKRNRPDLLKGVYRTKAVSRRQPARQTDDN